MDSTYNSWEILDSKFSNDGINIKNLLKPGSFMFNRKIYFIGGHIVQNGKLRLNKSVYSVKLYGNVWSVIDEQIEIPDSVRDPTCIVEGETVEIICNPNFETEKFDNHFKINLVTKEISNLELFPIFFGYFYPPIFIWNLIILVSDSDLAVRKIKDDK